jgi:GlcNAc-PI de-N-acetylase
MVGDNYGLGSKRTEELQAACERIQAKECLVLDLDELQDNPKLWWKKDAIIPVVKSWVSTWKADAIITFDHDGVSGHINHRAVSKAITYVSCLLRKSTDNLQRTRCSKRCIPTDIYAKDCAHFLPTTEIYWHSRSSFYMSQVLLPYSSSYFVSIWRFVFIRSRKLERIRG